MENWIYKCKHTNCLSLKNRNNQSDFAFHDTGRFQAEQITVNSDSRSLENVQELVSGSFDSLRPIKHNKGFGFLANEVEQIFPSLVVGCSDESQQSIDYNQLITLCVKEIQTLKKKINELEGTSTPCSVISADFTLDSVYINNALLGPTGTNSLFVQATLPSVKPSSFTVGPTGTSSTNNL